MNNQADASPDYGNGAILSRAIANRTSCWRAHLCECKAISRDSPKEAAPCKVGGWKQAGEEPQGIMLLLMVWAIRISSDRFQIHLLYPFSAHELLVHTPNIAFVPAAIPSRVSAPACYEESSWNRRAVPQHEAAGGGYRRWLLGRATRASKRRHVHQARAQLTSRWPPLSPERGRLKESHGNSSLAYVCGSGARPFNSAFPCKTEPG